MFNFLVISLVIIGVIYFAEEVFFLYLDSFFD